MATKYWIAKNPSSEVTDAEAQEVKELAQALDVGGVTALAGVASPANAAKATKCMEVNINGVTYFIPLYVANVAP